jgi:hypothetical protein
MPALRWPWNEEATAPWTPRKGRVMAKVPLKSSSIAKNGCMDLT